MSLVAPDVLVRNARAADLDAIAALEAEAFVVPWKREYFVSEIDAPHRFNRVARQRDGSLAGYLFCSYAAGEIHINKIAVSATHRRRGVATRLMDEVFALAARIRAAEAYLEVRSSNAPAILFYRGLGFVEGGSRKEYYLDGEDARVMLCRFATRS